MSLSKRRAGLRQAALPGSTLSHHASRRSPVRQGVCGARRFGDKPPYRGCWRVGATPRGRPQSDARENGRARGPAPTVALRAANGTAPLPVQNATRRFDRPLAGGTLNDRAMGVCRQGRLANCPYKCQKFGVFWVGATHASPLRQMRPGEEQGRA